MKLIITLAAVVAMVSAVTISPDEIESEWQKFKREYRTKNTLTVMTAAEAEKEEPKRRQIFADNYRTVVEHNTEADAGLHPYRLGVNEFADMTDEEFRQKYLALMPPKPTDIGNGTKGVRNLLAPGTVVPNSIDWHAKGMVTPIKDQKSCGSCFAFAVVDAVESQFKISNPTETLLELSVQQIVDCRYKPLVCQQGGTLANAADYVKDHGLELATDYPYEGIYGSCYSDVGKSKVTLTNYDQQSDGDEWYLREIVGTVGPVALGIFSNRPHFRLYKSGVYVDNGCHGVAADHGVVVVGYGRENDLDYWLIKNSWGVSWGQDGFIKVARNNNNQCGIGEYCLWPLGVNRV